MLIALSIVLSIVLAVSCWLFFKLKTKIKQQQKELAYAWQELTDARNQNANYRHAIQEAAGNPLDVISDGTRLGTLIKFNRRAYAQLAPESPEIAWTLIELDKFMVELFNSAAATMPNFEISRVVYQIDSKMEGP